MNHSKSFLLIIALLMVSSAASFAQNTQGALAHMEQITVPFSTLKKDTWTYLKSITKGKGARTVEKNRKNLVQQYKTVEREVAKLSPYEGDASLKNAAVLYLQTCATVLNEDFDKLVNMEEIAEQSYDLMEAYMLAKEKANEKLTEASDALAVTQNAFAASHNITIVEGEDDKLSAKIKKASDALKYYNKVYLVFFKCYKQELYVIDAQQRMDLSAFQQNMNALKSCAEGAIEAQTAMEAYSGDASLKVALRNMMNFYAKESEKDFPAGVEFIMKKARFDEMSKAIQAKTDRTQQHVDAYNKAVTQFNTDTQNFNKANDVLNKQRSEYLKQWNDAVEAFLARHGE